MQLVYMYVSESKNNADTVHLICFEASYLGEEECISLWLAEVNDNTCIFVQLLNLIKTHLMKVK